MRTEAFTLDSNVLVYAADSDAGERHACATMIVRRSYSTGCVLTAQALGEFYSVTTRKRKLSRELARRFVSGWQSTFQVWSTKSSALLPAATAEERYGLSFWDAVMWATAKAADCRLIVTEDYQHGRVVGGVTFVNPFLSATLPQELERVLAPA